MENQCTQSEEIKGVLFITKCEKYMSKKINRFYQIKDILRQTTASREQAEKFIDAMYYS
jgi:hypothetical protein